MKTESLVITHSTATGTAGNRLTLTPATFAFGKPLYLKQMDLLSAKIYEVSPTFLLRPIQNISFDLQSSQSGFITRPVSQTYTTGTTNTGSSIQISLNPDNCPAGINLPDIYIPAGASLTIFSEVLCAGIVATDTITIVYRIIFEFEGTMQYSRLNMEAAETKGAEIYGGLAD